jgi:hypothetical protein
MRLVRLRVSLLLWLGNGGRHWTGRHNCSWSSSGSQQLFKSLSGSHDLAASVAGSWYRMWSLSEGF